MSRIPPAPREQYTELFGADAPLRLQVYAQCPDIARAHAAYANALNTSGTLPRRLVELVRLRVAFHNQCRSCMAIRYDDAQADGVTEDLVCSLEKPYEAPDLTAAERLALGYADKMATDHLSVSQETFDGLLEHFTTGEVMELCFRVATFVGFGRMAASLDMVDDLPEGFRTGPGVTVTPWGQGEVVRTPAGIPDHPLEVTRT